MAEQQGRFNAANTGPTQHSLLNDPAVANILENKDLSDAEKQKKLASLAAFQVAAASEAGTKAKNAPGSFLNDVAGKASVTQVEATTAAMEAAKRAQSAVQAAKLFGEFTKGGKGTFEDFLGGKLPAGGTSSQGLGVAQSILSSLAVRAQPQYSSVEQAYKNVQIDALSKSPLELEIAKQQLDAQLQLLDELKQQNQISDKIFGEVQKQVQLRP
jgi:hypothetical protein